MAAKLPIDDPDYFWSRAEETRVMAEQMTDPEAKLMMLGVVQTYEKLAKRAEARLTLIHSWQRPER
jgi:hypothetical protein